MIVDDFLIAIGKALAGEGASDPYFPTVKIADTSQVEIELRENGFIISRYITISGVEDLGNKVAIHHDFRDDSEDTYTATHEILSYVDVGVAEQNVTLEKSDPDIPLSIRWDVYIAYDVSEGIITL